MCVCVWASGVFIRAFVCMCGVEGMCVCVCGVEDICVCVCDSFFCRIKAHKSRTNGKKAQHLHCREW